MRPAGERERSLVFVCSVSPLKCPVCARRLKQPIYWIHTSVFACEGCRTRFLGYRFRSREDESERDRRALLVKVTSSEVRQITERHLTTRRALRWLAPQALEMYGPDLIM